jgi:hypothetical protein
MILDLNRIRLAFVVLGFCLALGGIVLDNRPLTLAAMVSLIAALALRLYLRRRSVSDPGEVRDKP